MYGRSSCHPPTPAPEKPRLTILRKEVEDDEEEERRGARRWDRKLFGGKGLTLHLNAVEKKQNILI